MKSKSPQPEATKPTPPETTPAPKAYTSIAAVLADIPVSAPPIPKGWNDLTLIKFNEWIANTDLAIAQQAKGAKLGGVATINYLNVPKALGPGFKMVDGDKVVVNLSLPIEGTSFKGFPFRNEVVRYNAKCDRTELLAERLATLHLPAKCAFSGRVSQLSISSHGAYKRCESWNVYVKLDDAPELSNFVELPSDKPKKSR